MVCSFSLPLDRQELIAEMDGVLDELKKAQDAVHVELLATKAWMKIWVEGGQGLAIWSRWDGEFVAST